MEPGRLSAPLKHPCRSSEQWNARPAPLGLLHPGDLVTDHISTSCGPSNGSNVMGSNGKITCQAHADWSMAGPAAHPRESGVEMCPPQASVAGVGSPVPWVQPGGSLPEQLSPQRHGPGPCPSRITTGTVPVV